METCSWLTEGVTAAASWSRAQRRAAMWAFGLGLASVISSPGLVAQDGPSAPDARAAQMREVLALYGLAATDWPKEDRREISNERGGAADAFLVRALYCLSRLPPDRLQPAAEDSTSRLSAIRAAPLSCQALPVLLTGQVVSVEQVRLDAGLAGRVEFARYYRVTMFGPSAEHPWFVYALQVPPTWLQAEDLRETATASAIFLYGPGETEGGGALTFASRRIAWFPRTAAPQLGIGPAQAWLAKCGVDVGLLGELAARNRRPLTADDQDAFYQLLRAMSGGGPPPTIPTLALEVAPLLVEPERHHGQLVAVTGRARRVTKVRVDSPALRAQYGLDHYYQIDLFVPLDEQVIRLSKSPLTEAAPTFEGAFPVTVCVPDVPAELEVPEQLPLDVQMTAAFFKLWAYPSDYVSSFNPRQRQLSPMLIGTVPRRIRGESVNLQFGVGLAALLLLALGGLWWGLLRQRRQPSVVRRVLDERS
ncbi:MAG: hypothetical protein AB7O38_13190 [Pirellulaceae bacterium]